MRLDKVALRSPERTNLYLERYVNNGSPSGFTFRHTTSPGTKPLGNSQSFHLVAATCNDDVDLISIGTPLSVPGAGDMLFHPDAISMPQVKPLIRETRQSVRVAPTASGRTVKVLGSGRPFLKLGYPNLLGRIDRHLTLDHAIAAIETSSAVVKALDEGRLPKVLQILPETGARVAVLRGTDHDYDCGMVERQSVAHPSNDDVVLNIPGFALFSTDQRAPGTPLILMQLIAAQNDPPSTFLLERLLFPIVSIYFECLLQCGIQLELHAQNTLIGIDSALRVRTIIVRDAESFDRDLTLIETRSLPCGFTTPAYKCLREEDYNYSIAHSYMYDFKLGEYLIRPLVDTVTAGDPAAFRHIATAIRAFAAPYLAQLPAGFFPNEWYSYPDVVVDRAQPRPYINNGAPIFR